VFIDEKSPIEVVTPANPPRGRDWALKRADEECGTVVGNHLLSSAGNARAVVKWLLRDHLSRKHHDIPSLLGIGTDHGGHQTQPSPPGPWDVAETTVLGRMYPTSMVATRHRNMASHQQNPYLRQVYTMP
jgi:hypothetical protein